MKLDLRIILTAVVASLACFVSGAEAHWLIHNVDSLFIADKDNQNHPKKLTLALVVPNDSGSIPSICAGYSNTMNKKNKGKIVVDVELQRTDGTIETFKINGRVRDNGFADCEFTQDVVAGDLVLFSFKFKNMPRLRDDENGTDVFDAAAAVIDMFGSSGSQFPMSEESLPKWLHDYFGK